MIKWRCEVLRSGFDRDSSEISPRQPRKANKGPANLAVDHNNGENSFFSESS